MSSDASLATFREQKEASKVKSNYDPGMSTEQVSTDSVERKRPTQNSHRRAVAGARRPFTDFPQFVMVTSFLVTFGIVRFITYGIRDGWLPVGNASSGGTHLHHYLWGIALVFIAGYIQIAFAPKHGRAICAAFSAREALILDEFALLLNLKDVYWSGRGRESIFAVAVSAVAAADLFLSHLLPRRLPGMAREEIAYASARTSCPGSALVGAPLSTTV